MHINIGMFVMRDYATVLISKGYENCPNTKTIVKVHREVNYSINPNAIPTSPIAMPAPRPANIGIAPLA